MSSPQNRNDNDKKPKDFADDKKEEKITDKKQTNEHDREPTRRTFVDYMKPKFDPTDDGTHDKNADDGGNDDDVHQVSKGDNRPNKNVRDNQGGNGHVTNPTGLARDHPAHRRVDTPPPPQKDDKNPNARDEINNKANLKIAVHDDLRDYNYINYPVPPPSLLHLMGNKYGPELPHYSTTKPGHDEKHKNHEGCHLCTNQEEHDKHKPNLVYLDEMDDGHKSDLLDEVKKQDQPKPPKEQAAHA